MILPTSNGSFIKILLFLANQIHQQVTCQNKCFIRHNLKCLVQKPSCVYNCPMSLGLTKSIPSHLNTIFQMIFVNAQLKKRWLLSPIVAR
ncbi:hypothetical protein JHK87_042870 [Glycine soja]|nr:hypothetical protein JHK87_042870 [Glycine soja]